MLKLLFIIFFAFIGAVYGYEAGRMLVKRHVEVMTLIGAIIGGLFPLVLSAVFS